MRRLLLFISPRAGFFLTLFLVLAVGGVCRVRGAGEKKGPKVAVRFHIQTNAMDSSTFAVPVNMQNPPRQVFVERVPSIGERDIAAYYPLQAPNGTFGAEFQLDRHGQLTLNNLSLEHHGDIILAVVNGRPITPIKVDRTITDGILVIPFGLTAEEIRGLGETLPLIGNPPGSKPASRAVAAPR